MAAIQGLSGNQYRQDSHEYDSHKYQYATSSHVDDNRMEPALIVSATSKEDIVATLQYAKTQNIAVALRTGGHQYSGASSTAAPNIQLDLNNTFKGSADRQIFQKDSKTFVSTSVSWSLGEFHDYLKQHSLFVPHGICAHVHLGGHVQTGGMGPLARTFGLFGDHVVSIEIVDHEGQSKEVTVESDKELFSAILGGSPGNLGVITHFTIEVHRDQDYVGSQGLNAIFFYDPKTLKRLVDILVEMSDDENFPRNYDYAVNVLSSANKLLDWFPEIDGKMRDEYPELYGDDDLPFWPRIIFINALWVPFDKGDVCNIELFNRIGEGALFSPKVKAKPVSELMSDCLFRNVREFDNPYIKNVLYTNSTTLAADGWPSWVTERIDGIVKPQANRCYIAAQLGFIGGKNSKFTSNSNNGTSYSWRDSNVLQVLDVFYEPNYKQTAEDWQTINHQEAIGPNGKFSKKDRRVLWGSFGNFNLDACWDLYYEDREKYDRLRGARRKADPTGIFTPNTFCVTRE